MTFTETSFLIDINVDLLELFEGEFSFSVSKLSETVESGTQKGQRNNCHKMAEESLGKDEDFHRGQIMENGRGMHWKHLGEELTDKTEINGEIIIN